jgi:hypothetical protein
LILAGDLVVSAGLSEMKVWNIPSLDWVALLDFKINTSFGSRASVDSSLESDVMPSAEVVEDAESFGFGTCSSLKLTLNVT